MPIKFYINSELSICQTPEGTLLCPSTDQLDPALGIQANLRTLDTSQSHIGSTSLVSDINRLVLNFLVQSNFHTALDAAVTYNADKCGSSLFCNEEYYTPMQLRRELSRQTTGLLSLLMDSVLWKTLELATVCWGTYSLASGLILLLLRARSTCRRKR